MKPLRAQTFPPGSVEHEAAKLLSDLRPPEVAASAKQRVRENILRTPLEHGGFGFLRWRWRALALAVSCSAVAGAAGAAYLGLLDVGSQAPLPSAQPPAEQHAPATASVLPAQPETTAEPEAPTEADPEAPEEAASVAPVPPLHAPDETSRPPAPPAPTNDHSADEVTEASMLFAATRALRHEGNPGKATRILGEYFRKFPGGALSEEGLALSVEAAGQRGDPSAVRLARRYLKLYPSGHFRARAERVVERAQRQSPAASTTPSAGPRSTSP